MAQVQTTACSLVAGWALPFWTLTAAITISLPLLFYFWRHGSAAPTTHFDFMALPAEIRDMVYDQLVDQDCRPFFRTEAMRSLQPLRLGWLPRRRKPTFNKYAFLLANHQLHEEFMDVLWKKATFTLNVDRSNEQSTDLWPLSHDTVSRIRSCEIRIIATPTMLGCQDPRSMPREWALRDRVSRSLKAMKRVKKLRLHVHASPDRMWNPLWLWSQVSQQFKDVAEPQFTAITFGLDKPWGLGENSLKRAADGKWRWTCPEDHVVTSDPEGWQPIREFCATLYLECPECQQNRAG